MHERQAGFLCVLGVVSDRTHFSTCEWHWRVEGPREVGDRGKMKLVLYCCKVQAAILGVSCTKKNHTQFRVQQHVMFFRKFFHMLPIQTSVIFRNSSR